MSGRTRPFEIEIEPPPPPRGHPAVRQYTLISLVALLLMTVLLVDRELGWWAFLPVLAGALSMLTHWALGPAMVVMPLGMLIFLQYTLVRVPWWSPRRTGSLSMNDLLLCAAVLVFAATQYRIQALARAVFPTDTQRPPGLRGPDDPRTVRRRSPPQQRSPGLVASGEPLFLLVGAGMALVAAFLLWTYIYASDKPWYLFTREWHALQVGWAVCLVVVVAGVVRGFLMLNGQTPEEAMMYLQDQQWRETRAEQASINRWLVWRRLRAQRRKEER